MDIQEGVIQKNSPDIRTTHNGVRCIRVHMLQIFPLNIYNNLYIYVVVRDRFDKHTKSDRITHMGLRSSSSTKNMGK